MKARILRYTLLLAALLLPGAPVVANAYDEVCFLSGEREAGMNRICYYDCLSGDAAITINLLDLCPLTIRR